MGSLVHLSVGKLEIDWGKNEFYRNHSKLFLPNDIKKVPYYYADNVIKYRKAFSRKLKLVKRRLELLGYTKSCVKMLYNNLISSSPHYYHKVPISFEEFHRILANVNVKRIGLSEEEGDYDIGEFVSEYIFKEPEFNKIINTSSFASSDIGEIFENIDPYVVLRILMDNPNNSEIDLIWRYADIEMGGWVETEELYEILHDSEKILIVTEGSSDSFIIKKAIELIYPDILDFFYFVDMEENYPFTGTGNLFKFCQGLSSIKIQNNIIIIYDNDIAGDNKYKKAISLPLPGNMKIIKLPNHDSFNYFNTIGPNGNSIESINGSAVSIECFLDLNYKTNAPPCIRWTSYEEVSNKYQGELVNKEMYIRKFKSIKETDKGYNIDKLKYLIDYIYDIWTNGA